MTLDAVEGTVVGGRYRLDAAVGTGSEPARQTWRGEDTETGRPVAVTLLDASALESTDRFDRTADRLGFISHPGLAAVRAHGELTWSGSADGGGHAGAGRWFVATWAEGSPARELGLAAGLDVLGQTAMACQALHDRALAHGRVSTDHVLVRIDPAGTPTCCLVGVDLGGEPRPADDLAALGALATRLLRDGTGDAIPVDVERFLTWLRAAGTRNGAKNAGEIGRTALALATAERGGHRTTVVPSRPEEDQDPAPEPTDAATSPVSDRERRTLRNRLIGVGAVVVIGGGLLLRFLTPSGPSDITIPSVVGFTLQQAQHNLATAGLDDRERTVPNPNVATGDVISQQPGAGVRVAVGSVVTLTVSGPQTR